MNYFYLHEGVRYYHGQPFSFGDINYTVAGAVEEVFEELGFTRVDVEQRPDDKYYIVDGPDDSGKYIATPRELGDIQAQEMAEIHDQVHFLLQPSDWQVLRSLETGQPLPEAVKSYRAGVRRAASARESAVLASSSIDDLRRLAPIEWPHEP